jgi:glucan phosphoethanolaminetransferase (alkaline phosphatase superfamily)
MNESIAIQANWLNQKLLDKKLLVTLACIMMFAVYDSGNLYNNVISLMSSSSSLINRFIKVSFFISIALLTYYSIACCIIARSGILRTAGALLYFAGVINAFAFNVSGSFPDATLLSVAIQDRHFAGAFIASHWKSIAYTLASASAIFAFFTAIKARLSLSCSNRLAGSLLLLAAIANISCVSFTAGRRPAFYGYNMTIESAKALFTHQIPYTERAKVAPAPCTQCPDVLVYIIDESVNYEALNAVNSMILKTNTVAERLGAPAFSYKAYSAGNHSSVSNYILRLGAGKASYPDRNYATLALPNIFSYAKAAQYKTVFYDAQAENNRLQNDLSQFDLADIDHFITSESSTDFYNRDFIALQKLRKFVDEANSNNKVAITLVKWGIHFPYVNAISPQLAETLPENCRSADTSFSSEDVMCKKAQYETALKFSVDQFMEQLFTMLKGKNFALVYTSDHGQNLTSKYQLPHGSPENTSECEVSVPILIAGNGFSDAGQNGGIKSHFQIPATVLDILGFGAQANAKEMSLSSEWRGGSDFLYDPFEQSGQWRKTVGSCTY